MMQFFRHMIGPPVGTFIEGPKPVPPKTPRMDPQLEAELAMVQARVRASFTPNIMERSVMHIDPQRASLEELQRALNSCDWYWCHAYPETDNDLIEWIQEQCITEIARRCRGLLLEGVVRQVPQYADRIRDEAAR